MPPATNNISHLNPLRGIMYRKVAGMKDAKLYPYIEIILNVNLLMSSVPFHLRNIIKKAGMDIK